MSDRAPSQAQIIGEAIRRRLLDVHVALPARVEKVDLQAGTVDVKPLARKPITVEGEVVGEALPVLRSVPIWFPGAGGFRVTFPIAPGDVCLVVFGDYALDTFRASGGEAEPVAVRSHHLADGLAIFGLPPRGRAWKDAHAENMTIGKEGGPLAHFTAAEIQLGGSTDLEAAVLGDVLQQWLFDVWGWLSTLVLPGAMGPAGPPAVAPPGVPDVTSAVVKVKR